MNRSPKRGGRPSDRPARRAPVRASPGKKPGARSGRRRKERAGSRQNACAIRRENSDSKNTPRDGAIRRAKGHGVVVAFEHEPLDLATTPNGAHSGPSTVLMQASGFKPKSSIGPKVILGIIALAVLLAVPTYFMFRDRLLGQAQPDGRRPQSDKSGRSERATGQGRPPRSAPSEDTTPPSSIFIARSNSRRITWRPVSSRADICGRGAHDDAAKSCREILRITPDHLDARLQLAEIYHAKGNWTAAYREYRNIIEIDQSSPQAADALAAIESQQAVAQMEERAPKTPGRRRRSRSTIPSLPVAALLDPVPLVARGLSEARRVNPPAALSGVGLKRSLTLAAWPKIIRGSA